MGLRKSAHVALLCAIALSLSACDWSTFKFGPAHTGFNPFETTIGVGNVSKLGLVWQTTGAEVANSEPPAISDGVVYSTSDNGLFAFDAAGLGCTGIPATCSPLWTADAPSSFSSPTVAGGVVYASGSKLLAFDAKGETNCSSNEPRVCQPLWQAATGASSTTNATPVVAQGAVYVYARSTLSAFDAAGITGCSGNPKTCQPLWTATVPNDGEQNSVPAVANGTLFVGSTADHNLYAFDAAGTTNCSGTPKVCTPLWRGPTAGSIHASPAVGYGSVYVESNDGNMYAFDATGTTGCHGTPKVCTRLWTGFVGQTSDSPAIAYHRVYVGNDQGNLLAFDASGSSNCSGVPKRCGPLAQYPAPLGGFRSPAVANHVVYVDVLATVMDAFDADCTGTCDALWSENVGHPITSPVIANGRVWSGSDDGHLYAFGLPPIPTSALRRPTRSSSEPR
jgi:outer membrane protein assembly factor BamB